MVQGVYTKVAQVVAQAYQVDSDRVRITATSTGKVPNTSATAASSGSDINGMAALAACNTIQGRLVDFAAEHWGVPESQVERSEEHTSELQSLMRISYAVFCLKKKKKNKSAQ